MPELTRQLIAAAEAAAYAPSVQNTQPWFWRVTPRSLELYAERGRQLDASDPEGRLLIVSCGAALHHARVALDAAGMRIAVARLADSGDLLARITIGDGEPGIPHADRLFEAIRKRRTDRRPVVDQPVPRSSLDAIRSAITAEGIEAHELNPEQVSDLAVAAAHANTIAIADPAQLAELRYWVGGDRPDGLGVPDDVLPETIPHTDVPSRDFGQRGTLPVPDRHDRSATYLLLFGNLDEPAGWLRAGEALSAGWLHATDLGIAVQPLSSVVEIPATREELHRMLSHIGHPYVVLRLGLAEQPPPPHTPRLPSTQTIDTSAISEPE